MQRDLMCCELAMRPVVPPGDCRPPSRADSAALARLMLDAYRGTVDDGGETLEFAAEEVRRLFDGAFGAFEPQHSLVFDRGSALAAATLVTRLDGAPFLAFSMAAPEWKRRGYARSGLVRVMNLLREHGEARMRLVVTRANAPALKLYESLGFKRIERPPSTA